MKTIFFVITLLLYFFRINTTTAQNRIILNTSFENSNGYGNTIINVSYLGDDWGWISTDNNDFEIWDNNRVLNGVTYPSQSGNKYVEMNANNSAFLYQTVYLIHGETIGYSFYHMARTTNTEKAQFAIYNQSGTVDITKPLRTIANSTQALTGNKGIWKQKTGTWVNDLPTGVYRIGFVTPDGGSLGNLLDDITITLDPLIEIEKSGYSFTESSAVNPRLIVSGTVLNNSVVRVNLTPGTASKGSDYSNVSYIDITIPAGNYAVNNTFEIPINIVSDGISENTEILSLSIDANNSSSIFKIQDANSDGFNNGVVDVEILNEPPNGLKFDGDDSYVNLGRSSNYKPSAAFTFETWALASNWMNAEGTIVSNVNGKNGYRLKFNTSNSTLEGLAYINGKGTTVSYPLNKLRIGYHHFAMTFNGSSLNLLVDGLEVNSVSVAAGSVLTSDNAATIIGAQGSNGGLVGNSSFLNVMLDETKFWSAALTPAQIQSFLYSEITTPQNNLISYFNYNHLENETRITDFNNSGNPYNISNFPVKPFTESYAMIVPGLNQGTNITNSSFIANWSEPILGRTERYFLDVSTNNEFTSFVSGYNGLNVGLSNSYNVTGLSNNTTYYYRVRSNKNNLGDVGAIQYPKYSTVTLTTLAVELLEFNVYESLNHVYLNWKTASELNNHKFEIFKSYDCKNWIYIAEVKGYKNSSILMNYDFVDLTSNQSSLIYYKLNQIDLDGTVNELPIKSILINNDKIISFSPNPTNTDVFIKNGCEISAINLIDKNGVVVVNMSNCENLNSIDLSVFPNGIYYVKIFKKDGAIQFDKLIKY